MSMHTEHIAQLARQINRRHAEHQTREAAAIYNVDLLTTILETAEKERERLVRLCREAGMSWTAIAIAMGVTKQAAQQRYGH
jgi:hypothetical protein